jgi:hypothetical protein
MIRLTNFLCLYTIFLVTVLCTVHMRPGLVKINIWVRFFAPTYKVSTMGLKINNIYYEDRQLLGSHVSQMVFHVAFFESVLTWGHIATSRLFVRRRGERNIRLFASPVRLHHFLAMTHFNRPWCIPLTLTV